MKDYLSVIFIVSPFFYLLENVMVLHCGAEIRFTAKANPQHKKDMVMFSGLFFHSLLDGIIIGMGFEEKTALKLSTALALATPLGALISLTFIRGLSVSMVGFLLAMYEGSFLYIGDFDLILGDHKKKGCINA